MYNYTCMLPEEGSGGYSTFTVGWLHACILIMQRRERCFYFERDFLFTAEAPQKSRRQAARGHGDRQLADTETGACFSAQVSSAGSGQEADPNPVATELTCEPGR